MSESAKLPEEMSPAHYIEKVSLFTGEKLNDEIQPKQLLVHSHRDYHIVDIQARRLMSWIVRLTGDEKKAVGTVKRLRRFGHEATDVLGRIIGRNNAVKVSKALLGYKDREYYFRYKKPSSLSTEEINERIEQLREQAHRQLAAVTQNGRPALRVLLTGGTGFVGQELIWQAASDDNIAEIVILIRPKDIIDRKTKEVIRTLSPAERGEELLKRLWLDTPEQRAKFRFIGGDVEQPLLGVADDDLAELKKSTTHVIHCAASVSFDDPYEKSFQINVKGTLNALSFSLELQSAPQSPFIAHIGIETSYVHGRQAMRTALEDEIVFPRNFYNNYYELTKAMGSIETDRFMLEKGLRVVQLCPAIVIGDLRTGNNRGDTKVVNAPVNLFGRAKQALSAPKGNVIARSTATMLAQMACVFPADPSAKLNLIPVDWVVRGILASLPKAEVVGEMIHLATDNRITPAEIGQIAEEELGVHVRLAEPTLHRTLTLPILNRILNGLGQEKISNVLERLSTIFGSYSEWGQPVHEVGKDVRLLGMPEPRPDTKDAFRMLCRHNRYVQDFGQVRDLNEISRREKVWTEFIADLEQRTGKPVNEMPAEEFQTALTEGLDTEKFERI